MPKVFDYLHPAALALVFGCQVLPLFPLQAQSPTKDSKEASRAALPDSEKTSPQKVYVVPIQGDIDASIIYVIRRGVKEAMEADADTLILHMDTYGGSVAVTEEIFKVLNKFPHQDRIFTYIDNRAGSAGSIISSASREIYMAPNGVIGAAAVVNGDGSDLSETMDLKMTSFIKGITRAQAERQGLRPEVFEAMIDPDLTLEVDGKEISPKGSLLSLTSQEAARTYGKPPKPLLSSGTVDNLDALIEKVSGPDAVVTKIEPSGFEKVASFIVMISPLLMGVALLCGYMEFKTPGFGVFGITAIVCAVIFFFGHFIAGLTGYEYLVLFFIGVALVAVELFVMPGSVVAGVGGLILIVISLLQAMTDQYPTDPILPTMPQLEVPMMKLALGFVISLAGMLILARILPKTPLYGHLVLNTVNNAPLTEETVSYKIGDTGTSLSYLRPSGTADFGNGPVDVVSEGAFIPSGTTIRIIEIDGSRVVVEEVS